MKTRHSTGDGPYSDGSRWPWTRGPTPGVLRLLAITAGLALLALFLSNVAPGSEAAPGDLTIDKKCSPEAPVGGAIQYQFDIANIGTESLARVGVDDSVLGDITGLFPDPLAAGGSATVYEVHTVQESDWTPMQPLVNTVTARYQDSTGVLEATDQCTTDIPHLSCTKTPTFNDSVSTTLTITLTNDGSVPVRRYRVTDSAVGDITSLFPVDLAVGETAVAQITVTGHECSDTATAIYESVPRMSTVTCSASCSEDRKGSIKLTKIFEVGPFTGPTKVCFKIDPAGGIDPQEQCVTSFAPGPGPGEVNALFQWRELPFDTYTITETVVEPSWAYVLLPPIIVTIDGTTPNVEVPPARNPLQPGTLRVEKRTAAGALWSTPAVTFHICGGSLADCTPASPSFVQSTVVGDGNPNPSSPITLLEGYYTVCEVVPAGYTPDPARCQVEQVFAGDTNPSGASSPGFVSIKNVPTGEGCTPGFWKSPKGKKLWDNISDAIPQAILSASSETATTGSSFYNVFDVSDKPGDNVPSSLTLLGAVELGGGNGAKLARTGTAALLNAAGVSYPLTINQVLDQVKAAWDSGNYEPLASQLDRNNNLGCPF